MMAVRVRLPASVCLAFIQGGFGGQGGGGMERGTWELMYRVFLTIPCSPFSVLHK